MGESMEVICLLIPTTEGIKTILLFMYCGKFLTNHIAGNTFKLKFSKGNILYTARVKEITYCSLIFNVAIYTSHI